MIKPLVNERWIVFPAPKEKTPKFIHLLPEHAEMIKKIRGPKGPPDLYFFRHVNNISGVKAGVRFGQKQFRKWWNQACKDLNTEGVDLYGGTKHSTLTALGKVLAMNKSNEVSPDMFLMHLNDSCYQTPMKAWKRPEEWKKP